RALRGDRPSAPATPLRGPRPRPGSESCGACQGQAATQAPPWSASKLLFTCQIVGALAPPLKLASLLHFCKSTIHGIEIEMLRPYAIRATYRQRFSHLSPSVLPRAAAFPARRRRFGAQREVRKRSPARRWSCAGGS